MKCIKGMDPEMCRYNPNLGCDCGYWPSWRKPEELIEEARKAREHPPTNT